MNPEELISKYLDGELTAEEDLFMRSSLASDPEARELFDDNVNIHLALREDARSIMPPASLVSQTEDLLMMRILASTPALAPRPIPWILGLIRPRSAFALAAILLLMFVYNTGDLTLDYAPAGDLSMQNPGLQSQSQPSSAMASGVIAPKMAPAAQNHSTMDARGHKPQSSYPVASASAPAVDNLGINSPIMAADNLISNPAPGPGDPANDRTIASLILNPPDISPAAAYSLLADDHLLVSRQENLTAAAGQDKVVHSQLFNNYDDNYLAANLSPKTDFYADGREVQVTSFLGTDVVRSGQKQIKNAAISHFSQSIAYDFNSSQRIGIEMGYTQYSFNDADPQTVAAPIVKTKHPDVGIESVNTLNSDQGNFPYSINQTKQMVWGAAFFEQSLIRSDAFSINGRIGLGATADGPLGYGKLFAKYELLKNVSLTFGTDGRMFYARLPEVFTAGNQLNLSASLIYGLQIKF